MRYADFISQVQERAELGTEEEARGITGATLETLGERISQSVREGLEDKLPDQLTKLLRARFVQKGSQQEPELFPLEEFYQRVSQRSDTGHPRAIAGTKAVMAVLKEATTATEWDNLQAEMPAEYDEILA